MHRWLSLLLLGATFFFPLQARAQSPTTLSSLKVELWPEYDQPSVLVIYDFKLPDSLKLPVNVSVRFPKDANLIAVASQTTDGSLLNTDYLGPSIGDTWQTVTVQIQTPATYHMEYYEPLTKQGKVRQFSYLWPGDYAIADFSVSVRIPVDTSNITTDPALQAIQSSDGTPYLAKDFGPLEAGQQWPLQLNYTKTSETLGASQQHLQPSQPLGPNTPGRVMLSNYLPYVLGALGFALIIGGSIYFWQSSRGRRMRGGGRQRHAGPKEEATDSDVYCHQCGTRAQMADRFCRVCGAKLKLPE
jgi:hypothetical protein